MTTVALLALLALILLGTSSALVLRAAVLPRTRRDARVRELDNYGYHAGPVAAIGAAPEPRTALNLVARIGDLVARRIGDQGVEGLRRSLQSAGMYGTSPRTLLGWRVLAAAGCGWLALVSDVISAPVLDLGLIVIAVWAGWHGPLVYVRRRARERATAIDRALPDLMDQIVVTLESGMGFTSSLQLAARRLRGPLGEELRLAMREHGMGLALRPALENLRLRADVPNVQSFVRAVTQGEELGVSIGMIMRNLAIEMRKRRRQAAEEQAQKAPIKMMFPLVLLIFPAMGIVLLGPALFRIMHAFGG